MIFRELSSKKSFYKKWNRWGKMPHFSQNCKFLQILFLRNFFISNR